MSTNPNQSRNKNNRSNGSISGCPWKQAGYSSLADQRGKRSGTGSPQRGRHPTRLGIYRTANRAAPTGRTIDNRTDHSTTCAPGLAYRAVPPAAGRHQHHRSDSQRMKRQSISPLPPTKSRVGLASCLKASVYGNSGRKIGDPCCDDQPGTGCRYFSTGSGASARELGYPVLEPSGITTASQVRMQRSQY